MIKVISIANDQETDFLKIEDRLNELVSHLIDNQKDLDLIDDLNL